MAAGLRYPCHPSLREDSDSFISFPPSRDFSEYSFFLTELLGTGLETLLAYPLRTSRGANVNQVDLRWVDTRYANSGRPRVGSSYADINLVQFQHVQAGDGITAIFALFLSTGT